MSFFRQKDLPLTVDLHSHLIPNIDDGSQSMAHSLEMLKELSKLGVKKVITTPHIHPRYPNTPAIIMTGLEKLQKEVLNANIDIEVEAAAEYYVDDNFSKKVLDNEPVLFFGDKYVLVEAPFQNKPIYFEKTMFDLQSKGYRPILAHPERYKFLEGDVDWLISLHEAGVLMQVTVGSIAGYYGTIPAKIGSELLKLKIVDFLGSDLHRFSHIAHFKKGLESKEVRRALARKELMNSELL